MQLGFCRLWTSPEVTHMMCRQRGPTNPAVHNCWEVPENVGCIHSVSVYLDKMSFKLFSFSNKTKDKQIVIWERN